MMLRLLQVLLAAVLSLCTGCKISLKGVPIAPGHEQDAAEPLEDAGMPLSDAATPHEDDDAASGDAAPPQPEADAAQHSVFLDNFDRLDTTELDEPWRLYTAPGSESLRGGVRDERLCLSVGDVALLVLPPDDYSYFRFDVPGGNGLELLATMGHSALFSALWSGDAVIARDGDEETPSVRVGEQHFWEVLRVEVVIDHEARKASFFLNDEHAATVPLTSYVADPRDAFLPISEAERAAHLIVRIRRTGGLEMACVDNVYVGPKKPDGNPFVTAQPVLRCRPSDTKEVGCLSQCCSELIALDAASCEPDQRCLPGECLCGEQYASCAETCLVKHPSHSFHACTVLCSDQLVGSPASDYMACVDASCDLTPDPLTAELVAVSWPAEPVVPEGALNAVMSLPPTELAVLSEAKLMYSDFRTLDVTGARFPFVGGDQTIFWADDGNHRFAMGMQQCGAFGDVNCRAERLYTWDQDMLERQLEPRELRFPAGILTFGPSSTLRYLVVTTFRGTYLVTHDGKVLDDDQTVGFFWGPDDAYAITGATDTVLIDFASGTSRVLSPPEGSDEYVIARFRDKLAWAGEPWVFTDLAGNLLPNPLPGVSSLQLVGESFYASSDALYEVTPDDLVRRGAMPSNWQLEAAPSVLAADASHSLMIDNLTTSLLHIHASDGQLVASRPRPFEGAFVDVLPCGPRQGLLDSKANNGRWSIEAFTLQGESIVTTPLLGGLDNASEHPTIQRQRRGCVFLLQPPSGNGLRYDVETGEQAAFVPPAGDLSWAHYPSQN
jgi:hypothetical protein